MACQPQAITAVVSLALCLTGCSVRGEDGPVVPAPQERAATREPFSGEEAALLDEVQQACFLYFWREVGSPAKLVRDRKKAPVSSVAAVGFQLSSLPIGVERGWITRAQGLERAMTILRALVPRRDNKKFGVYLHFPNMNSGGLSHDGYEVLASTVDHALFAAGAITAGEYFGGEVARLADRVVAEANWKAYAVAPGGCLSMGWKPSDPENIHGDGRFIEAHWSFSSDEERLTYFLATGSPIADHALDPAAYYRLKRPMKRHADGPSYVVSWPGALFTYIFSHCWIDYRALGRDDPRRFGIDAPPVDWFENSRRAVITHRQRCVEQAGRFKTLADDRWGLSACAGRDGYIVPQVRPNASDTDEWFEGTVAPYAAVSAIMFTPRASLAAIRAFRKLKDDKGEPLVWRDSARGGYGFVDAFNLDQGYASDDYVGIDQGPILLGIENARSGLVWKLFMRSGTARRALDRLQLPREQRVTGQRAGAGGRDRAPSGTQKD